MSTDQRPASGKAASPGPIIVGIDGSRAAIKAAVWAAEEAVHRKVQLRLVTVVAPEEPHGNVAGAVGADAKQYAETALRAACAAVEATGLHELKVDTAVMWGDADPVLLAESSGATLICVGSVGIGRVADMVLGSTAMTLANEAYSPVAIIRSDDNAAELVGGYIAVVVDDRPGNDELIAWAMEEAGIRKARVLALTIRRWGLFTIKYDDALHRLNPWLKQYPDVEVEVAATPPNVTRYLESFLGTVRLAVIGSDDADHVARLIGPHGLAVLAHADCSVLVVRGNNR